MSDVGLDGADSHALVVSTVGAEHGSEGGGLDRVADRGAGAVQFDVLHLGGVDAGLFVRRPQHRLLCCGARYGQALARAVVVERAASDHAVDTIAVRDGPTQWLENDGAAAFTWHEAVRAGVERVRCAVRRERTET